MIVFPHLQLFERAIERALSAKPLEDVWTYLPARITSCLFVVAEAAALTESQLRGDHSHGIRVMKEYHDLVGYFSVFFDRLAQQHARLAGRS
jgi:hypothetical protein